MSGVGSSSICGTPSCFLILPGAAVRGRKSATAADITTTSQAGAMRSMAACICAAVSTGTISTPADAGRSTVETSVTAAPRRAASSAIA